MAETAHASALIARSRFAAAIAVVGALGWAPATAAAGRAVPDEVVLTIHHSRFSPAQIDVPPGRVTFVVRNTDPIGHELIIGDRATQDRHEVGTDAHHDSPGAISVAAGSTRRTTYTFAPSTPTLFGCHLPGHWAYGMRGLITVGPARA